MAQEVNLLDPLGIAKAVRGQINTMAVQAKLPQLPEVPVVKMTMPSMPGLNSFVKTPNRPGYERQERAG